MATQRLVVDFERAGDAAVLLRVSGKLDRATVPLLDGVLRALRTIESDVTVDLAGVEHIDAHGLDVLLAAESPTALSTSFVQITGVRESLRNGRPADREPPERTSTRGTRARRRRRRTRRGR